MCGTQRKFSAQNFDYSVEMSVRGRVEIKNAHESVLGLSYPLLGPGFMSLLSSTCHSAEGDNYRSLIQAAYMRGEAEVGVFHCSGRG